MDRNIWGIPWRYEITHPNPRLRDIARCIFSMSVVKTHHWKISQTVGNVSFGDMHMILTIISYSEDENDNHRDNYCVLLQTTKFLIKSSKINGFNCMCSSNFYYWYEMQQNMYFHFVKSAAPKGLMTWCAKVGLMFTQWGHINAYDHIVLALASFWINHAFSIIRIPFPGLNRSHWEGVLQLRIMIICRKLRKAQQVLLRYDKKLNQRIKVLPHNTVAWIFSE